MPERHEVVFVDGVRTPFGRAGEKGMYWQTRADDLVVKAMTGLLERNHPFEPDHLHLALLGVVPDHQGTGIGSALLRSVLDRADREGTPAYLEATSDRNRALYERHGFVALRQLQVLDCPPLTAMWREPQV